MDSGLSFPSASPKKLFYDSSNNDDDDNDDNDADDDDDDNDDVKPQALTAAMLQINLESKSILWQLEYIDRNATCSSGLGAILKPKSLSHIRPGFRATSQ